MVDLPKRLFAEGIGTFWLVFGGCGSAVLAAAFPEVGIGLLGVSLAFGLTVLTMAFAIGHISGCHLNPAVTLGLVVAKRHPAAEMIPYWVAQVVGALAASGVLFVIASGQPDWSVAANGLAANGFGEHSPGNFTLVAALVAEVVLTAMFLMVILGATDVRAPKGLAPVAIGLCLTLIHLISIPGDQHLGESCPKHGTCCVCGWRRANPIVGVLGGSLGGCGHWRVDSCGAFFFARRRKSRI